jgi:hypothetical protein
LLRDGNSKDSTSSKTCFIMNNVFNFRRWSEVVRVE